jgi:hypothetical protein
MTSASFIIRAFRSASGRAAQAGCAARAAAIASLHLLLGGNGHTAQALAGGRIERLEGLVRTDRLGDTGAASPPALSQFGNLRCPHFCRLSMLPPAHLS